MSCTRRRSAWSFGVAIAAATSVAAFAWLGCVSDEPATSSADDGGATSDGSSGDDGSVGEAGGQDAGSGEGGADADAGAFTPAVLDKENRLALWLEASRGVGLDPDGGVSLWTDQSKNHNDAAQTFPIRPTVDATAVHNHPAVSFQTNDALEIPDSMSLHFGVDEVAILVVGRYGTRSGLSHEAAFYSKAGFACAVDSCSFVEGLQLAAARSGDAGVARGPSARVDTSSEATWSGSVFDDDAFHVFGVRRSLQTSFVLYSGSVGSAQTSSLDGVDVSQLDAGVLLGTVPHGNLLVPLDMEIAELVVIHASTGVVVDADVANVIAYLKAKYAL